MAIIANFLSRIDRPGVVETDSRFYTHLTNPNAGDVSALIHKIGGSDDLMSLQIGGAIIQISVNDAPKLAALIDSAFIAAYDEAYGEPF